MKKKSNLNKNFLSFFRKIHRPLLDRVVKSLKPITGILRRTCAKIVARKKGKGQENESSLSSRQ